MAGWEERFDDYVERLGDTLGHADRWRPLRAYSTGLLLPGERKSVEPMAARVARSRERGASIPASLRRQGGVVGRRVLTAVRGQVLPGLSGGRIRAWIVDDTGFRRRAGFRSVWRASTAASSASRRILTTAYPEHSGLG